MTVAFSAVGSPPGSVVVGSVVVGSVVVGAVVVGAVVVGTVVVGAVVVGAVVVGAVVVGAVVVGEVKVGVVVLSPPPQAVMPARLITTTRANKRPRTFLIWVTCSPFSNIFK